MKPPKAGTRERRCPAGENRERFARQVENLYQRARLIQRAIIFGTISVLFAAVLIITLFFTALMKMESAVAISLLFPAASPC